MVEQLECAVTERRLTVPASIVTTEELLSATRRNADYAFQVGRFYLQLASLDRTLKEPRDLMFEAISAYAQRAAEPTPYMPLNRSTRQAWERLAAGQGNPDDVQQVIGEVQEDVDAFYEFMQQEWEGRQQAVREARRAARRHRQPPPPLAAIFDREARKSAERFARRAR